MVAMSQIGRKLARKRARKAFIEAASRPRLTGAEAAARLVKNGVFGAWAERHDIGDSSVYARELRDKAQWREHN